MHSARVARRSFTARETGSTMHLGQKSREKRQVLRGDAAPTPSPPSVHACTRATQEASCRGWGAGHKHFLHVADRVPINDLLSDVLHVAEHVTVHDLLP